MRPINEEEARQHLTPYIRRLSTAVKNSVNNYFSGSEYASVRHKHSARTSASICHDEIKAAIIREFEGDTSVTFMNKKGLFLVVVEGIVVLRFKKFNKDQLSSGIETQQMMAFNHQEAQQLELPDMPPNGLLHIGYRVNNLQTGLEGVYVTCRYGNKNLWGWNITSQGIEEVESVLVPIEEATTPARRRKITAKGKDIIGGGVNAAE